MGFDVVNSFILRIAGVIVRLIGVLSILTKSLEGLGVSIYCRTAMKLFVMGKHCHNLWAPFAPGRGRCGIPLHGMCLTLRHKQRARSKMDFTILLLRKWTLGVGICS